MTTPTAAAEFESWIHAEVQGRSQAQGAAFLRGLGIQVREDARDYASEATQITARAKSLAALANGVCKATGKADLKEAADEVLLWRASHVELQRVTAQIAELESKLALGELDTAVRIAKAQRRHTPAREAVVRGLLASKDVTMAGAKALVSSWGVVAALANAQDGALAAMGASSEALTWNGNSYAQLTSAARLKLKRENEELFNAMRQQWLDAGQPAA